MSIAFTLKCYAKTDRYHFLLQCCCIIIYTVYTKSVELPLSVWNVEGAFSPCTLVLDVHNEVMEKTQLFLIDIEVVPLLTFLRL